MTNASSITVPEIGLTEIEGEPRARDLDIAVRLGITRPRDIRRMIKDNMAELETFGVCASRAQTSSGKGGRPAKEYWLNEEQALLVSVLSNAENAPAVRGMLIRTFVAWRRGHLTETPVALLDDKTKNAIGGIVKSCTAVVLREQLGALLPAMLDSMVTARLAEQSFMLRRGRTAGEIWRENGFPRMKVTSWFSNRLVNMGCQIDGGACGELGGQTSKLFDPDKARLWLQNGGRALVNEYVAQRQGQKVLRLVPKATPHEETVGEGASA